MKSKTKPRGRGVTVKLMEREFREALEAKDGNVVDVLTESFGDKSLARMCLAYLAISASHQAFSHKIVRWFFFAMGVGITLGLGLIVRLFTW